MITTDQIEKVQSKWGENLVEIGRHKNNKKDYEMATNSMLNELYAFENGEVLFKPTRVVEKQFRLNLEAAKSYFIGGNPNFSEDLGFALEPWVSVKFVNGAITLNNNHAIAMGNYFFTSPNGEELKAEYTFGYIKDKRGDLKINLHHSSVPFNHEK
ncbi:MAG: hypothetical protein HOK38_01745 [Flavobacteriaceae bacterium]|nr:hypothetical protein [Flavobacteriaceae bacterium]